MRLNLFLIFLISAFISFAQFYTQSDSLRGFLNDNRSCYDVNYYDLMIDFNIDSKSISGKNDIYFEVLKSTSKIQIDLFNEINVDKVIFNNQELEIERLDNAFNVSFDKLLEKGSDQILTIEFSGKPIIAKQAPWDGGFVWSTDSLGNPWIGTAVQGIGASLFWPCKDHLSDEPDSVKVTGVVPDTLDFVCNGDLFEVELLASGKKASSWKVSYPINNYNISMNIGKYIHFNDIYVTTLDTLKLDYYVLSYNLNKAKRHFKQVQPMLSAFEKRLGKFPFWDDGYALIETPYLGMEHQCGIAYGNEYKPGYRNRYYMGFKFDYIIIHETGHEYWGNSVSMNDVADMWIHESFCTYSEAIYVEELYGYEKMLEYMMQHQKKILNDKPIQGPRDVNQEGSSDMYYKGAWMLQSMRHTLNNDSIWWSILEGIQRDFKIRNVDRTDIIKYFKDHSPVDFTPMFKQFLDHTKPPKLEYRWEKIIYNSAKPIAWRLHYRWSVPEEDFNMLVKMKRGVYNFELEPSLKWNSKDFKIELPSQIEKHPDVEFGHEYTYFVKEEIK